MCTLIPASQQQNTRTFFSQRPRPCLPWRRDTGRRRCAPDRTPVYHPVLSLLRGRHRGGHPSAEPAQYDGQSSHARRRRPVHGRRQVLLDVQPVQATPRKALQLLRQLRAAVRSLKGLSRGEGEGGERVKEQEEAEEEGARQGRMLEGCRRAGG